MSTMSELKELRSTIKERLKYFSENFKSVLEADQKKQAYIAKLKAFYKETEATDSDRW